MAEYIEREKMNDTLDELCVNDSLYYALQSIPTADVASVRHGHWVICSDGYYPYCSECCDEPKGGVMTKYCPNCGAKMDGKDGKQNL